ncbi:DUF551 domain-containing protein [Shigella flexneri]
MSARKSHALCSRTQRSTHWMPLPEPPQEVNQ